MKKEDRRVVRTRRALRAAMLSLLKEKSYTALTIQDLAERAGLNRATFYHHYKDKEELLVDSLESHFDEWLSKIEEETADLLMVENAHPALFAFRHVEEFRELYEVLLSENGPGLVMQRMIDYMAGFSLKKLKESVPEERRGDMYLELVAQNIAGSLFASVRWWFQKGMPCPAEQIARLGHELITRGLGVQMEGWLNGEVDDLQPGFAQEGVCSPNKREP